MSDWHLLSAFSETHRHQRLALASLVHSEGSSYRSPGARMIISESGTYQGALSGGCLEQGIAHIAQDVIKQQKPRIEIIDTRPHFGCPGTLTFLIEPLRNNDLLESIYQHIKRRETFHLKTTFNSKHQSTTLASIDDTADKSTHIEKIEPNIRVIAIGATPDLQPVFEIANTLAWQCHQVVSHKKDLQKSLANIQVCPASEFNQVFRADNKTAIVIMSHHLASDLSYLKEISHQNYQYIGLLGSRRRRESLLSELGDIGLLEDSTWLDYFYAPIGIDLGGKHPTTIALSIISEIQAKFYSGNASSLRKAI